MEIVETSVWMYYDFGAGYIKNLNFKILSDNVCFCYTNIDINV